MNQTAPTWRTTPVPEILSPASLPAVGGPIGDARRNIDQMVEDMKTAMRFAIRNSLPILTMAVDRNGAYLVIAPVGHAREVFGDECGLISAKPEGGMVVEQWLGCVDNVRVFWREFKPAH